MAKRTERPSKPANTPKPSRQDGGRTDLGN
jgi:hypothetical protein